MDTPTHLFNRTATLMRETSVQDSTGGVVRLYASAGTFRCRLQVTGMGESRDEHGDDVSYFATMYCGPDVEITDRDRVVIGGTTYKVGGINSNQGEGVFQTVNLVDSL